VSSLNNSTKFHFVLCPADWIIKGNNLFRFFRALNPQSDWITVDVPAIIDKEIFQLAQNQREKN
jgi:hypothetical protein